MNIELKRIAEKKIEQLGGTVHGVLVKNEAGAWAAVSEAGRVMWLDDFEGQAARAQGGESERQCSHCGGFADYCDDCGYDTKPESAQGGRGAELIECTEQNNTPSLRVAVNSLIESARCLASADSQESVDYWAEKVGFYRDQIYGAQPLPAVPEGWLVRRVDDRITVQHPDIGGYCASKDGEDHSAIAPVILYHLANALISTPTTPQADGRVHAKCGGRVIGRMRDGDSVSCEKCGRTGHVLIDDGGIDIDWMPAGQEGA